MENKIYVIIRGEYSDWKILGYAESKKEARKYCKKINKNQGWEYNKDKNEWERKYFGDNCYYIEVNRCGFVKEFIGKEMYVYELEKNILDKNSGILFCNDDGEEYYKEIVPKDGEYGSSISQWKHKVNITVMLEEENKEKALKIAADMYAQWAYENLEDYKMKQMERELREKKVEYNLTDIQHIPERKLTDRGKKIQRICERLARINYEKHKEELEEIRRKWIG